MLPLPAPGHPHTHHMSSHARAAEQTSPDIEPTSTRRTRDKVVLPHAPQTLARDAIPKIFLVARARDSHPDLPSFLLLVRSLVVFFSLVSLARPLDPRAFEHGTAQRKCCDFGRARARTLRSSRFIFFFSANVGLERQCPSSSPTLLTYRKL